MASQNVHTFTAENFESEVLQSPIPVLVDFTATWCGPCKALAPFVEKLANEFQGKVKVGKLDIDAAPKLAQGYGVRSVPTCILFEGGNKVKQQVGLTTYEKLAQLVSAP
ncbi:thioredoxin [Sorangium cellulosum]|uniref:Thioredoxin n=1 Tax=Sorangium cellulosum TaxID=56 RepID=A0A150QDT0_SORCE|nr:thioredoxin [Sorangium cellulosum]KYF66135.1 thiol-disulfide isomerase [Sorangium cellulosum]